MKDVKKQARVAALQKMTHPGGTDVVIFLMQWLHQVVAASCLGLPALSLSAFECLII